MFLLLRNLVNQQKLQIKACVEHLYFQLMLQGNSNQAGDIEGGIEEFYLFQLSNLEKRMQIIINQLKIPLNYIFPSDFEQKYEEAKSCEYIDSYWIENYKEIVAFFVEGQINSTLMFLSEKFRHQFGGQTMFWMDLICNFAQDQKYDENIRIWQVNDVYKQYLHLQKGEYEKNRKFRRLAKTDIQVSKKLISVINQLKSVLQNQTMQKENTQFFLNKVEANYKLYEDSNKKIVEFLRSNQQKNLNLDFFQPIQSIFREKKTQGSSYSNSRTKRTRMQKERESNPLKQRMITDFSVQLREDRNALLLKKIVGKKEQGSVTWQEKKIEVDKCFESLPINNVALQNLRQQLTQRKPHMLINPMPYYSNISISYSYLSYNDFFIPIERFCQLDFSRPLEQYPEVNYCNNDYEQYEDCQAEELDVGSEDQTSDESLDSQEKREMYQQEDPYEMDTEDMQVFVKAIRKDNLFFGKAWVFDFKNTQPLEIVNDNQKKQGTVTPEMIESFLEQSTALCFLPLPMPIELPKGTELDQAEIEKLTEIVHLRSYNQIFSIIEDESLSQTFSKQKVHQFLGKMTKKVRRKVDGVLKNLYIVLGKQTKQSKTLSNNTTEQVTQITENNDVQI